MCDDNPDLHVDLHEIGPEDDLELAVDATTPPQDKACRFPELKTIIALPMSLFKSSENIS